MQTLEVRATRKACLSQFFWASVWIVALVVPMHWFAHEVNALTLTISQSKLAGDLPSLEVDVSLAIASVGLWATFGLMIVIFIWNVHTFIYGSREVNVFSQSKENGPWTQITSVEYHFPAGKTISTMAINRIVNTSVSQSAIDRLMNTGSLWISVATFVNGDVEEVSFNFDGINEPHEVRAAILAGSPEHEGVGISILTKV